MLTYAIVALLLLLLAAGVFAAVRYFFIEGTLHFSDAEIVRIGDTQIKRQALRSHWLSGDLEWATGAMAGGVGMGLSPVSDEIIYVEKDGWPPTRYEIWRAKWDGSEAVNLTERAGLGAISCSPQWSPDGQMIAFNRSDPAEGQLPCEAGFHMWVMASDGSAARRVTPEESPPTRLQDWSPDGSRLLCIMGEMADGGQTVTMDLWGRGIQMVPNVGAEASWSPDGTMIASRIPERGEVDGDPGVWLRLVVIKADGSDPEVFAEQFVCDAGRMMCRATPGRRAVFGPRAGTRSRSWQRCRLTRMACSTGTRARYGSAIWPQGS
jgi:hypothetical protein